MARWPRRCGCAAGRSRCLPEAEVLNISGTNLKGHLHSNQVWGTLEGPLHIPMKNIFCPAPGVSTLLKTKPLESGESKLSKAKCRDFSARALRQTSPCSRRSPSSRFAPCNTQPGRTGWNIGIVFSFLRLTWDPNLVDVGRGANIAKILAVKWGVPRRIPDARRPWLNWKLGTDFEWVQTPCGTLSVVVDFERQLLRKPENPEKRKLR